jgi:hypothetical protein
MQVTSYQMHHVIECFSKKLSRNRESDLRTHGQPSRTADEAGLNREDSRQAAIESISERIVKKIAQSGAHVDEQAAVPEEPGTDIGDSAVPVVGTESRFTYRVVDSISPKRRVMSVSGKPSQLMQRLDQLAKGEEPPKTTDSWV